MHFPSTHRCRYIDPTLHKLSKDYLCHPWICEKHISRTTLLCFQIESITLLSNQNSLAIRVEVQSYQIASETIRLWQQKSQQIDKAKTDSITSKLFSCFPQKVQSNKSHVMDAIRILRYPIIAVFELISDCQPTKLYLLLANGNITAVFATMSSHIFRRSILCTIPSFSNVSGMGVFCLYLIHCIFSVGWQCYWNRWRLFTWMERINISIWSNKRLALIVQKYYSQKLSSSTSPTSFPWLCYFISPILYLHSSDTIFHLCIIPVELYFPFHRFCLSSNGFDGFSLPSACLPFYPLFRFGAPQIACCAIQ